MDGAFEQKVRERAYGIWLESGRADGQAHDHWTAAQRELTAAPLAPKKTPARKAPVKKAAAAKPSTGKTAKPSRVKYPDSPASAAHSR